MALKIYKAFLHRKMKVKRNSQVSFISFCGSRLIDLSGLQTLDQIAALATTELAGYSPDTSLALLCLRHQA